MLAVQGYLIIMVVIGWKLIANSYIFRRMSLWKQVVTLFISPLLLTRDIFRDFKRSQND